MRVVVGGDFHVNSEHARRTMAEAGRLGARWVLQVGDMGWDWPGAQRGRFERNMAKFAERYGVQIAGIGGNHENWDTIALWLDGRLPRNEHGFVEVRPGVFYIPNGTRWTWAGRRFGAMGGAVSTDAAEVLDPRTHEVTRRARVPGKDWWPDAEAPTQADIDALGDDPLDVLVTHECPAGHIGPRPGWDDLDIATSQKATEVAGLIKQAMLRTDPSLLIHGHHHHRHTTPSRRTVIEGLGRDGDREGSTVLLELPSLKVTPVTL